MSDDQLEKELSENESTEISSTKKFVKEFKSIVLIVVTVLAFRSTFFEPFKIPSGSMIPTLLIGDFILVNKFSYGFKVPFSDWFSDPIYLTGPDRPERGDVVVFKYPKNTELNYIKRVVGLPGDTVQIIDKVVYVNDQPVSAKPMDGSEIMEDMDDKFKRFNFKFFKTQTGEHEHVTQVDEDNIYIANFNKIQVPQGHYFVMGDNRDFSADSRIWGFVPFENIKGEAILVWFSLSFPWPWSNGDETFKFRPWRIGTLIE
ncbi:MAG: signal peptidase I [Halobacteriovoraceae bacterium]|nr:signal peptidase I [Halobacteriovoraceae bacterium]|tara:strand:+ start:90254 stop:91030 length:777 start_codon:yes stop_codon:yes gene_type:complete